jgi:hypothetical protein
MLKPSAVLERLNAFRANSPSDDEIEGGGPRLSNDVIEAESRDEDAIT